MGSKETDTPRTGFRSFKNKRPSPFNHLGLNLNRKGVGKGAGVLDPFAPVTIGVKAKVVPAAVAAAGVNGENHSRKAKVALATTTAVVAKKKEKKAPEAWEWGDPVGCPKIDVSINDYCTTDVASDPWGYVSSHYGILYKGYGNVRIEKFRQALTYNRHLVKGKIVLDVGCGTGILAMMAAKAGAAKVIAVDCSNIAEYAAKIVKANKLDDIITVVKAKMEEIEELPHGILKVDLIVSDWMGRCLFLGGMLDTVLHARDKWLKPGGVIFPDKCTLFLSGADDRVNKEKNLYYWRNSYGFNMESLIPQVLAEPWVKWVCPHQILTDYVKILKIDLNTQPRGDLDFDLPFVLPVTKRPGTWKHASVDTFVVHFDVEFSKCHKPIKFSTSSSAPWTPWVQTAFYTKKEGAYVDVGDKIPGRIRFRQKAGYRSLLINITVKYESATLTKGRKYASLNESVDYRLSDTL